MSMNAGDKSGCDKNRYKSRGESKQSDGPSIFILGNFCDAEMILDKRSSSAFSKLLLLLSRLTLPWSSEDVEKKSYFVLLIGTGLLNNVLRVMVTGGGVG